MYNTVYTNVYSPFRLPSINIKNKQQQQQIFTVPLILLIHPTTILDTSSTGIKTELVAV